MHRSTALAVVAALGLLGGCSAVAPPPGPASTTTSSSAAISTTTSTPSPITTPTPTPMATPTPTPTPTPTGPTPSDGAPREARLSIPAITVSGVVVQPYQGWTDDGPGTAIQNRGLAASPFGPRGGTGAGGVGNYQVTAHRTTKPAPFRDLPALAHGALVHVDAVGVRYTYRVTATRETSFRSPMSLAEQRAAVPGNPGVAPTQAMITLSTCLTPEDHAAGNFWNDQYDNPEHRVDKIGVLVETVPAPA
jgi:sortase A